MTDSNCADCRPTLRALHRFAAERCRIIEQAMQSEQDPFITRQVLVGNTLKFAEESLTGWVSGSHFELCVFVDPAEPLLFAYYDTRGDTTSRSMQGREQNPNFYVDKRYEVTKILQAPTSHPRVIPDTREESASYVFTTDSQRKQVRSSVILCLDLQRPFALVVSSDQPHAFREAEVIGDPRSDVMPFISYIGDLVRYDLIDGNFVAQIRNFKPRLFSKASR